jgi:2-hydroxychromene-2-carboxylate isomerase
MQRAIMVVEVSAVSAVRKIAVVEEDGEITVRGLPFRKGDRVRVSVLKEGRRTRSRGMTAGDFLKSSLIGMWADREDIGDSSEFARSLRERAQRREDAD